jgi:acetyl-CoA carboxylase biotin carboxyl carrier protein
VRIGGRSPPFPDADLIRTLAALLTETGLTEIEYAIGNRRIRIARAPGGPGPGWAPVVPPPPANRSLSVEHPGSVKAPMVGTAYLAVAEGEPLLIIEAMKVMNQIRAHRSGRIAQILVADAQPVEYGAVLMLIE